MRSAEGEIQIRQSRLLASKHSIQDFMYSPKSLDAEAALFVQEVALLLMEI